MENTGVKKLETKILEYLRSFQDENYHEITFISFGLKHEVEEAASNLENDGLIEIELQSYGFFDANKTNEISSPPSSLSARVVSQ